MTGSLSFQKIKLLIISSDSEIKEMLQEIRIEKAMAAELAATANIIKKTGMFDNVDRIYGDYEAMNGGGQNTQQNGGEDDGSGGMGGGMAGGLGGDLGDDMDLGEPGTEGGGDLGGETGEVDMGGAPSADSGEPLMEIRRKKIPLLKENKSKKAVVKSFTEKYFDLLSESKNKKEEPIEEIIDFLGKTATMESKIQEVCSKIDKLDSEEEVEDENLINNAMSALSMGNEYIHKDEDDNELE